MRESERGPGKVGVCGCGMGRRGWVEQNANGGVDSVGMDQEYQELWLEDGLY